MLHRICIAIIFILLQSSVYTEEKMNMISASVFPPLDSNVRIGASYERLIVSYTYCSFSLGLLGQVGNRSETKDTPGNYKMKEDFINTDLILRMYFQKSSFTGFFLGFSGGYYYNQMTQHSTPENTKLYVFSNEISTVSIGTLTGYNYAINKKVILGVDLILYYIPRRRTMQYTYTENGVSGTGFYDYLPAGIGRLNLNVSYRF